MLSHDNINVPNPTPDDQAVGFFTDALKRKVEALVREGFEQWDGEMIERTYTLSVSLHLERRQ
jgi:hypothetical protein